MSSSSATGGAVGQSAFLRLLLIVHGVITLTAAVVLAVVPAAIPATVGIALPSDAFLLSYLLAVAELAIGIMSLGAARLSDPSAVRLIVVTFVVFHLATAGLELVCLVQQGVTVVLMVNVLARLVVAALLAVALRSRIKRADHI